MTRLDRDHEEFEKAFNEQLAKSEKKSIEQSFEIFYRQAFPNWNLDKDQHGYICNQADRLFKAYRMSVE